MATGIPNMSNSPDYSKYIKHINATLEYEGKASTNNIFSSDYCRCDNCIRINGTTEAENTLFWGDNFDALLQLLKDGRYNGKIKLIYIDPPFSTKGTFNSRDQKHAYSDILSGGQFIEFLRKRLIVLRELLAEDGSLYLHLDNNMAFSMKLILDEIFGEQNFRAFITRKKCSNKNYTKNTYGNVSDYILFYSKSNKYIWNRCYASWDEDNIVKQYPCIDAETGRRYKKVPIHAPGVRNGETGKLWRGKMPPAGKHWQYTPDRLDEMDKNGEIYWSQTGNPRRKVFFDSSDGIPVQDIWLGFRDSINQNVKTTGYPTEKNLEMLKQIVSASSNKDDYVLDCFCGSGTTLEAAYELGRKWIGVDSSEEAIKSVLKRFVNGTEIFGDYVLRKEAKYIQTSLDMSEPKCHFNLLYAKDKYEKLENLIQCGILHPSGEMN